MGTDLNEVVTLGHGKNDGSILDHEYLGGEQVKRDVATFYNIDTGKCHINGFKRDNIAPFLIIGIETLI